MEIDPAASPILRTIVTDALAAVRPEACVASALPQPPHAGRTLVLGLGKAAAAMAVSVEARWPEARGLIVTRAGYERPLDRMRIMLGTHPTPSSASEAAGRALLEAVRSLQSQDLVLVLLSGGASALACVPAPGLSIEQKATITTQLLRSGATIDEVNVVRRHLSLLKGGQLAAAAHPATVVTLAISDVVGDRAESIGSGPTVADPSTIDDAREVWRRWLPEAAEPPFGETIKPGDPRLARASFHIVARGADAVAAAARSAVAQGFEPVVLGESVGEAAEVGAAHARIALAILQERRRVALISGGELTVRVRGTGRGGPNQEYALAAAIALNGAERIEGCAIDTDGADGTHDVAGGYFGPRTLAAARGLGLDPERALAENDSGALLAAVGGSCITGPTGTNVNDLRVILIEGR